MSAEKKGTSSGKKYQHREETTENFLVKKEKQRQQILQKTRGASFSLATKKNPDVSLPNVIADPYLNYYVWLRKHPDFGRYTEKVYIDVQQWNGRDYPVVCIDFCKKEPDCEFGQSDTEDSISDEQFVVRPVLPKRKPTEEPEQSDDSQFGGSNSQDEPTPESPKHPRRRKLVKTIIRGRGRKPIKIFKLVKTTNNGRAVDKRVGGRKQRKEDDPENRSKRRQELEQMCEDESSGDSDLEEEPPKRTSRKPTNSPSPDSDESSGDDEMIPLVKNINALSLGDELYQQPYHKKRPPIAPSGNTNRNQNKPKGERKPRRLVQAQYPLSQGDNSTSYQYVISRVIIAAIKRIQHRKSPKPTKMELVNIIAEQVKQRGRPKADIDVFKWFCRSESGAKSRGMVEDYRLRYKIIDFEEVLKTKLPFYLAFHLNSKRDWDQFSTLKNCHPKTERAEFFNARLMFRLNGNGAHAVVGERICDGNGGCYVRCKNSCGPKLNFTFFLSGNLVKNLEMQFIQVYFEVGDLLECEKTRYEKDPQPQERSQVATSTKDPSGTKKIRNANPPVQKECANCGEKTKCYESHQSGKALCINCVGKGAEFYLGPKVLSAPNVSFERSIFAWTYLQLEPNTPIFRVPFVGAEVSKALHSIGITTAFQLVLSCYNFLAQDENQLLWNRFFAASAFEELAQVAKKFTEHLKTNIPNSFNGAVKGHLTKCGRGVLYKLRRYLDLGEGVQFDHE